MQRVEPRADADSGQPSQQRAVAGRRRVGAQGAVERLEEREPGRRPGARRASGSATGPEMTRPAGRAQAVTAHQRHRAPPVLRAAGHERAADHPYTPVARPDHARPGDAVPGLSGPLDLEATRPGARRPRADVSDHVRVRVHQLEHEVTVAHVRMAEHDRPATEVEMRDRVQRVDIRGDDRPIARIGELPRVAERVQRRVTQLVGAADARLGPLHAEELEQREAVQIGEPAERRRPGGRDRGRGRGGRGGRGGARNRMRDRERGHRRAAGRESSPRGSHRSRADLIAAATPISRRSCPGTRRRRARARSRRSCCCPACRCPPAR